ncbi:Pleckstrin homology-like domain [Plasmopara halstedii]|uniref:Pleckstrin homology-like domain n=1 Tax=Plasmopara halstedii TaxID=4781 RepID=A0A0P1AYS3_PLAHL|nr:Pleckstrin homology-like domain [Plasmopara halstedii]CEG47613.1 Pleckstrin homology-like domain [Plasmopara halstedii]|eukprot:XP_024583982.1 Pleckstrin homology-like domain [Plasmopara halstedii]
MEDDAVWLSDLAALASLSVAVHYVLGIYGLVGALLLFILLQRGAKAHQRKSMEDDQTPFAIEDESAERDNEVLASEVAQEEKRDMIVQRCQHVSSLIVSDVGSLGVPVEEMAMNSRTPIAFETELFVGHALFLVRTKPEDPFYASLFNGKRRMFWIQVQGCFKQAPKGPVYLGGELPAKIAPGVFTRSVAHVIMGLIRRLVGQVSFSFGDSSDGENFDELPAVAFPLFQSVDQFVETPEGHVPPILGTSDFGESEESRRQRRLTSLGAEKYTVGPTYTFDFHTMYVDLTRWETANLPGGLNAMNLASFFDSLPLRLVAYEVRPSDLKTSDRHRQRDKEYLFSFQVKYDKHRHHYRDQVDTEWNRDGVGQDRNLTGAGGSHLGSDMSTMSTTLSDTSSFTEEDPTVLQDDADFVRLEHARRLKQLSISYLCWMEEVDLASDLRRVHYVFVVKDNVGDYDEDDNLAQRQKFAIVSSYELRNLLLSCHNRKRDKFREELAKLRLHSRSRIGSYSTITTEAHQLVSHLMRLVHESLPQMAHVSCSSDCSSYAEICDDNVDIREYRNEKHLVATQAALYNCLMKRQCLQDSSSHSIKLTPSRIGVNLSRRDREDMKVICEGVVYRFYATEFLRQEVFLLTKDELLFYRSYASSAEKQVPCSHIIGVIAVPVPLRAAHHDFTSGISGVFALQITTFAEKIVLCIATRSARDAWVRSISQFSNFRTNFEHAQQGRFHMRLTATTALQPANRIELNSRQLFPQLKQYESRAENANHRANMKASPANALNLVKSTLMRALHILNNAQQLSVNDTLAFLDAASAIRAVDLLDIQDSCSHEEQIAFYLNLYHTILAHAMIATGFPRKKSQWKQFFTQICYVLSRGPDGDQVSLSLAEIEHVILRARLPCAELPYLSVASVLSAANGPASRLQDLGINHPDFRLSLALVSNHMDSNAIMIYEPESVHDQLNAVLRSLLTRSSARGHLEMKEVKNTIVLPRVFEWYLHDFGVASQARENASAFNCVRKLIGFMDSTLQLQVINALGIDDAPLRTTFCSFKYTPKSTLVTDASCALK